MDRYRFYRWSLDSQIPLPLPRSSDAPDMTIFRLRPIDSPHPIGYWDITTTETTVTFTWEEAGTFTVDSGREIVVHPKSGCSDDVLVDSLLGECLGTALIQRGAFCLHASAVCYRGTGIVFTGTGGQGKSTLAWMSTRLGGQLITDEIVVIDGNTTPMVVAGPPVVKVRDSVLRPFVDPDTYPKAFAESEKRLIRTHPIENDAPLGQLLFLRPGDSLRMEPITKAQAAMALLENTFAAHLTDGYGERFMDAEAEGRLFARCGELAEQMESAALMVPPTLPSLDDLRAVLDTISR